MKTEHNPILENLRYESAVGALDFNGIRYLLIRPETLMEIQKVIEEKFGINTAREIFYQSGFRGTSLTARKLLKDGLTPRQCLEEMFRMGSRLGWGKFDLLKTAWESERTLEVAIQGSPFARAYGSAEQPVCSLLCGALAGIFTAVKSERYRCRETRCLACGQSSCFFLLNPD